MDINGFNSQGCSVECRIFLVKWFGNVVIDLGKTAMMSLFTRTMMVVAVQRDHL